MHNFWGVAPVFHVRELPFLIMGFGRTLRQVENFIPIDPQVPVSFRLVSAQFPLWPKFSLL